MRVWVIGSGTWKNKPVLFRAVANAYKDPVTKGRMVVVHGGGDKGADALAGRWVADVTRAWPQWEIEEDAWDVDHAMQHAVAPV